MPHISPMSWIFLSLFMIFSLFTMSLFSFWFNLTPLTFYLNHDSLKSLVWKWN